jgi:glutamine amidotransferase
VPHPIFTGIPDNANFYFVHSYYVNLEDKKFVAGETEYGISFPSMIIKDKLIATQFHPEKSGEIGLKIYDNFIKLVVEPHMQKQVMAGNR